MVKPMTLSNLFITGCDSSTEWMLPWFVDNFRKHMPNAELMIMDFGMETSAYAEIRKSVRSQDDGWFKKPKAMIIASAFADKVCWLDTDCEIKADISDIFNHIEPNKLAMGVDHPWTKRTGQKWHNSGVVAFQHTPGILHDWAKEVSVNPKDGDQQVLHHMIKDGMKRLIHITDLPQKYNTLRLDVMDNNVPEDMKVMHWTGYKGKDHIRKLMNG